MNQKIEFWFALTVNRGGRRSLQRTCRQQRYESSVRDTIVDDDISCYSQLSTPIIRNFSMNNLPIFEKSVIYRASVRLLSDSYSV